MATIPEPSSSAHIEIGVHDELHKLRARLAQIYEDMSMYEPPIPKPPVLDSSLGDSPEDSETAARGSTLPNEALPGLRALKEAVKRDLEVLEKVEYLHGTAPTTLLTRIDFSSFWPIRNVIRCLHYQRMRDT
jgi:hypothetical protein